VSSSSATSSASLFISDMRFVTARR
jgi:hypothetical protein